MTILKNTNAHALRFTVKIGKNIQVFNVPAGAEVDLPGNGTGYPKGLILVKAKKVAKKAPATKPEVKKVAKKETNTDE